jgi:hypothetical protein
MGDILAVFKRRGIEIPDEAASEDTGAVAVSGGVSAAEFHAMQAELASLKGQLAGNAQFTDAKLLADGKAFAQALFTANKALPAQLPAIVKGFVAAAKADRTAAEFNAKGEMKTPTLEAFKACFDGMTAHQLTEERIADVAESEDDAIFAMGNRPDAEAKKKADEAKMSARLNPANIYAKRNGAAMNDATAGKGAKG